MLAYIPLTIGCFLRFRNAGKEFKMEESISKEDWEKTPESVKRLVKTLAGTLNRLVPQ